ncbi:hypothetical protein ACET3X_004632 [Alternaria dauci]|uniref:Uncharacterized protein n=1 Tax=Alternaria dauci TaxID=48095 RepID=A0ABR3UNI6_9PLEO
MSHNDFGRRASKRRRLQNESSVPQIEGHQYRHDPYGCGSTGASGPLASISNSVSFQYEQFGLSGELPIGTHDNSFSWQYQHTSLHASTLPQSSARTTEALSPSYSVNHEHLLYRDTRPNWSPSAISNTEIVAAPPPDVSVASSEKGIAVCFGMIKDLQAKVQSHVSDSSIGCASLAFLPPDQVTYDGSWVGRFDDRSAEILRAICEDPLVDLQLVLMPAKHPRLKGSLTPVSAILYGPRWLSEDIGTFCQDCEIYLQDPLGCDRDVPYCNPHRLSSDQGADCTTFELRKASADVVVTQLHIADALDILSAPRVLSELDTPRWLKTELLLHQRQALSFMVKREMGWDLEDGICDVWTKLTRDTCALYRNNITGDVQADEPSSFRGGILADTMGLGKSLSMIALLTHGIDSLDEGDTLIKPTFTTHRDIDATLLIVPPSLLQTWEEQLHQHSHDVTVLRIRRHHGLSRITTIDEARSHRLVLTTYQTVETEWREQSSSAASPLFAINWRRIILDEAHYISNHQSNTCKAICSLEAQARWAVTGTPLQNRLGDVATLCQFLRVHPYDDRETFNKDIIDPWKAGDNNTAISRLKRLLQCILLRRSKGSVQLPERTDLRHTLQLSEDERHHYATAENTVARSIDAVLGANSNTAFNVTSIIQQINELRLICNLGTYRRRPNPFVLVDDTAWSTRVAQRAMNAMTATKEISCNSCGERQDGTRYDNSFGANLHVARLWLFSCSSIACETCVERNPFTRCSCTRRCPAAIVTHTPGAMDSGASSPAEGPSDNEDVLPTKVNALVADLLKQKPDTKSIVFTFWSSTLNLIERGLSRASITFTRYDGNTTPTNRSAALNNFRRDPSISVILMTISCAAVGLNITAATRAYIMEPQWNPTVEEQALARVHRMGQTKEVTTIRFVMADTFEERVLETQQRKRDLAELLLSTESHAESERSLDRLRYFRSLLK